MADATAAVELLLIKLNDIQVYHRELTSGVKSEIEDAEKDIQVLREFLKGVSLKQRRMSQGIQALVQNIHDVVDEVEDKIDSLVFQNKYRKKTMKYFLRYSTKPSIYFNTIGTLVKAVRSKVDDVNAVIHADEYPGQTQAALKSRVKMVGFEDEISAAITYLSEETEKLDVIALVGMPGIGKTRLAKEIFDDPKIVTEFQPCLWVHVSNEYTRKTVFLEMLRQFDDGNITLDVIIEKSESELHNMVLSQLESKRFLIVLDDVWSNSDWDRLAIFKGDADKYNIKSGKVLITSCSEELGRYVNRYKEPHILRPLNDDKSWELLQLDVFGGAGKCPPQLEMCGKLIASECNGLPLAILIMGEILSRDDFSSLDIKETETAWIKACQNVDKYRSRNFFDKMPSDLQVCFLYLAAFPCDYEIQVGHLVCLWIAEGFIVESSDDDSLTLEEKAESYLEALVDRNLLIVCQVKDNGSPKTCRVHRMLHDFCKTEAGYEMENIVTEMKFANRVFEPPITQLSNCRRISIHSNVSDFLSAKPFSPHTRSLLSFSKDEISSTAQQLSAIPEAFKLLRVLDFKPVRFTKVPSDMYILVRLRYLVLSVDIRILPASFNEFWNIQTLVYDTTYRVLDVKANILKMTKLRHFRTNASANLRHSDKSGERGESLQSLGSISPQSCTKELFSRASKLKKLRIRGKLFMLMDEAESSVSFKNLAELGCLDYLKLVNDVHPLPPAEGPLLSLPPATMFPETLKTLTLAATFLKWSQMSILGLLGKLEVLKLKEKAFVGRVWETVDGGFRNLEALHIDRTDLVIWVASDSHFPRLKSLNLRHCDQLQEVPIALANIQSLRVLHLFETKLAAASAGRFEEKRQSMAAPKFNLSIYPKPLDK